MSILNICHVPVRLQLSCYSHTDPEAFFLEVFFNAHPILQPESKEKQRAANALIPTVIAYAGGQVDFTVDMGTEVCAN